MHNASRYKDRIRIRACGILVEDGKVLLAQIHSPITDRLVWLPPGGQVEFGESLEETLVREFYEEAGLEVSVEEFQFINQLIEPPYHAVELYYSVKHIDGEAVLGYDPELKEEDQLLKDLQWISIGNLDGYDIVPEQLLNYLKSRL